MSGFSCTIQRACKVSFGSEEFALKLDEEDDLAEFRARFSIPKVGDGTAMDGIYLCGNSLGLMPTATRDRMNMHLDIWASKAVDGHFEGREAWMPIEDLPSKLSLDLVGARAASEVVYMNSLSLNLHLMMVAFYRPDLQSGRTRILMEERAFPSDEYVVSSQIRYHGLDPSSTTLRVGPRSGESLIRTADILRAIEEARDTLALILLPGVHYLTGQVLPMSDICRVANAASIPVGFDLAHAVGNIELNLHDWGVDFACWCTYKYLNSGPGSLSGVFLHEKHRFNYDLPRFAGWWGHERSTRFEMGPIFNPQEGAYGFQLSNPSVFGLVPVISSLEVFREAGLGRLLQKSKLLTTYLEYLLSAAIPDEIEIVTPRRLRDRGSQLSYVFFKLLRPFFLTH